MHFPRLLSFGLFTIAANAQSSSSNSESSSAGDSSNLSGASELATPTGPYLSYGSTKTLTSSALTTAPVVSLVSTGGSFIFSTVGSTTIFGINTMIASNASGTASSTTSDSQLVLSGRPASTASGNGTSNSTASSAIPSATNTTPCNNYPEFCSRKYGNITEVAAHNSPFTQVGSAAANQDLSVTAQLDDGIRLLQGQIHFVNSTPHFCHTSCSVLDAGPITTYLTTVREWVDKHPYDIVTILLGNGDYTAVEKFVPFIEQTGLVQYAYLPPKIPMGINDWPTLASMILTGKRVVIFMDYDANQGSVPWILDEFSQMWETPFDPVNRSFPCTAQRPPDMTPAQTRDRMYMINHNLNFDITLLGNSLLVPNRPLLNQTNNITGFGSLGTNAEQCTEMWGYEPKFLNVDYYNIGNGSVFEVAAKMNNVTYNRPCCGVAVSASIGWNEMVGRSVVLAALCVLGATILLS